MRKFVILFVGILVITIMCTVYILVMRHINANAKGDDPVGNQTPASGTHWVHIPTNSKYTLYYNTINEEVISLLDVGSGRAETMAAVNVHYKNYLLYYNAENEVFYYYDDEGNPHQVTVEDINIPSKFFNVNS